MQITYNIQLYNAHYNNFNFTTCEKERAENYMGF